MQHISATELHGRMTSENRPVLMNALSEEAFEAKRIPGYNNVWDFEEGLAAGRSEGYRLTGTDVS